LDKTRSTPLVSLYLGRLDYHIEIFTEILDPDFTTKSGGRQMMHLCHYTVSLRNSKPKIITPARLMTLNEFSRGRKSMHDP